MNIERSNIIDGVLIIKPDVYEDYRGRFIETYDKTKYDEFIPTAYSNFIQDDVSISKKNVLRGIHGDSITSKLVCVLYGEVYSIIADNRPNSPTYRMWQSFTLTGNNRIQLFLPPGIGNSTLTLIDESVYSYKQTTNFSPKTQFTIKWDEASWNFWWPIQTPILSKRDFLGKYSD